MVRGLRGGGPPPRGAAGLKSPHHDAIEHDTLVGSPAGPPRTPGEGAPPRQPWCSHDNSEIWSYLVGDEDDE